MARFASPHPGALSPPSPSPVTTAVPAPTTHAAAAANPAPKAPGPTSPLPPCEAFLAGGPFQGAPTVRRRAGGGLGF